MLTRRRAAWIAIRRWISALVRILRLPENGFLTPTMKIKRPALHEAYGPQYAGWYAKNSPVVWAE